MIAGANLDGDPDGKARPNPPEFFLVKRSARGDSAMTRMHWDKASIRTPDPAREQSATDIMAPDPVIIAVQDLTPNERKKIERFEARQEAFRKALRAKERERKKRRSVAQKVNRAKRPKIFDQDAIREARLKAESEARQRKRNHTSN